MYRKCLKQRLAHGKYPEMSARIITTTATIILCYFPIQLRKEGDMDSKKCNPSTVRMLKFISWVDGETKARKGSVQGRPTAPFRVHEKEAPGLTAWQEHRVDSSPCSPLGQETCSVNSLHSCHRMALPQGPPAKRCHCYTNMTLITLLLHMSVETAFEKCH